MRSAKFDTEIEIRTKTPHQTDSGGGFSDADPGTLIATLWAAKKIFTAREQIVADQIQSPVIHTLIVRTIPDLVLKPQYKVKEVKSGDVFEIHSVNKYRGSRRFLEIRCAESVKS